MDPASGTFTSMDTYAGSLSDPMSLHKYLFANSNPVMYSDPSGHYTLTEQETAIAIQAILGEAISGIVYIFDWFITDPDSKNHSIGKMIIAMMLGLARSAVMGSWGGLLSGLISKAGMSVLDYLLTGIMFALFSGNLKLAAINLRESGNFKVAAICNAGGAFADFVAFCSVINAVSTYAASKADNKSSKNKKYRNNKRGAVRIGGSNGTANNNEPLEVSAKKMKHVQNIHNPHKAAEQINQGGAYNPKKTYFNKNWSEKDIEDAVNYAYNKAVNMGFTNGTISFSYKGEKITIYMYNGQFKTAYGNHIYTLADLLSLLGGK